MTTSLDISQELQELSPLLASLGRRQPFCVPENYFQTPLNKTEEVPSNDHQNWHLPIAQLSFGLPASYFAELHQTVLWQTANPLTEQAEEAILAQLPAPAQPFSIPNSYFATLEDAIKNRAPYIEEEITHIQLIHQCNQRTMFIVPSQYFEQLNANIISRIQQLETGNYDTISEVIPSFPKSNTFTVPNHFFDQLAATISKQVEQVDVAAPALDAIGKTVGYTVPTDYFDTLRQRIVSAVGIGKGVQQQQQTAKVRSLWGVAAAAAVAATLFIGIALFNYTPENGKVQYAASVPQMSEAQIEQGLAELPAEALLSYLKSDLDDLSDADLVKVIDPSDVRMEVDFQIDDNMLKELVKDIDIEDLYKLDGINPSSLKDIL